MDCRLCWRVRRCQPHSAGRVTQRAAGAHRAAMARPQLAQPPMHAATPSIVWLCVHARHTAAACARGGACQRSMPAAGTTATYSSRLKLAAAASLQQCSVSTGSSSSSGGGMQLQMLRTARTHTAGNMRACRTVAAESAAPATSRWQQAWLQRRVRASTCCGSGL